MLSKASGQPQVFVLDTARREWRAPDRHHGAIPASVEIVATGARSEQAGDRTAVVRFFPEGAPKLLAPLIYVAMLVVAMPFVFGPQRSAGTGQRLLIGLLLGLAFFLSNYLLGNVVLLYGFPPLVGASLPTLLSPVMVQVLLPSTPAVVTLKKRPVRLALLRSRTLTLPGTSSWS